MSNLISVIGSVSPWTQIAIGLCASKTPTRRVCCFQQTILQQYVQQPTPELDFQEIFRATWQVFQQSQILRVSNRTETKFSKTGSLTSSSSSSKSVKSMGIPKFSEFLNKIGLWNVCTIHRFLHGLYCEHFLEYLTPVALPYSRGYRRFCHTAELNRVLYQCIAAVLPI